VANLIQIAAKNGNYLLNVAPGPTGQWASSAVNVLTKLASWYSSTGEAITATEPIWPYQMGAVYTTASTTENAIYINLPASAPDRSDNPEVMGTWRDNAALNLPWLRPSLLKGSIASITKLGSSERVKYSCNDSVGVIIDDASPQPWNCSLFDCDCEKEAVYYNIDGGTNFGCAPLEAQTWWLGHNCDILGPQPGPHPGCDGPTTLSTAYKIMFTA